ncbi:Ribophorin I [Pseudovirgaria hyperparasitica]|uniref:Dolichyl-diphosphooligosaccharide--protein glycosyltransferase subunit 1 n=1 Tax=Pseudovirgaria hyperparasitica TaxID=470096 RepID=A0A6A6WBR5_9PEZI|nr:Ribophorin I [Pseudovirgaria hyperparasitica]KAF2760133.1 Ribophorin I [Pseudovirgaria hyperparasitica]
MILLPTIASCLTAFASLTAAQSNFSEPKLSKQILPAEFKPPQVFRNTNLVKNIDLSKEYARETVNLIIENIDSRPQSEYYLPFESALIARIGGFEVRDKKDASKDAFRVEVVEYDTESSTEFYRIHLPSPLKPKETLTLSISYTVLSALEPLPAEIEQVAKQYVQYTFSAYTPSAYLTQKQKTKLKFPTSDVPDYSKLPKATNADGKEDPQKQGKEFTYGPYADIPAGASAPVAVRYEFTKPLIHASLLERDIEISHWGGNIAFEERYWLTNRGAKLKDHFSRVSWAMTQFQKPATFALKELKFPLAVGSVNPYFTDDIGNVSTSRFRSNAREANLELKPRYPLFGGWNYKFRVGWDADLKGYLRKLKTGDGYILKVPFLEGPKASEGIEYKRVELRVVLPEGAQNIKFDTSIPLIASDTTLHHTFMDTLGRPTVSLTAINLVDDLRERDLIITYDYAFLAGFRKPIVIFSALVAVFTVAWVVGSIDVSIAAKNKNKKITKR